VTLWCAPPLVLASRSAPRRAMLEAAGIPVDINVPQIDERAVEMAAGPRSPADTALLLAAAKAKAVNAPDRLVVGADQTLALGEQRFDKPIDRAAARSQLTALAGKTHELYAAVAVARDGAILFEAVEQASLVVRPLTDAFIDTYLEAAGDAVLASVGAYQLERIGVHLFERVIGDHFTILGLPLWQLLDFLRREGSLAK
jgi:septum formation protein